MTTHAHTTEQPRLGRRQTRRVRPRRLLTPAEWLTVGWGAGLLGGVVMALPLILWDWVHSAHIALELPMAVTAWLFGLQHFSQETYLTGSIVVGVVFLCVYWVASGLVFTALADRLLRVTTLGKSLAAGAAWSFVSFIFFWDMLLPIARDGAPFRPTAALGPFGNAVLQPFAAAPWVWIVAFTAFGLATGAFYAALRAPEASEEVDVAD